MIRDYAVPLAALCPSHDIDALQFERSDQLLETSGHFGQERAIDALRFGIQVQSEGYNVFVMGPPGSHRHGLAEQLTAEQAAKEGAPDDWCFVHNFAEPERPHVLQFPAGSGSEFRNDMRTLIEEMRLALPAAFEAEDYRNQLEAIEQETEKQVKELWSELEENAAKKGIALLPTPTGYVLAPIRDEKVLGDKEFEKLPESDQQQIKSAITELSEELQGKIERMPQLRKTLREKVKKLNEEVTANAVGVLIAELKSKYKGFPPVAQYLGEVQQNITENADRFREQEPSPLPFLQHDATQIFGLYEVNLVVNNSDSETAPVVYESNPTYRNIVGNVEHRAEMGALVTDFRLIRSGALLRANGGYLVLDVERVLRRPFVWEALKQALLEEEVRIESPGELYGFVSTTSLKPQPIPLDIKIILIGPRWLYYLLSMYDSEFNELFKIAADFDDRLPRNEENASRYALLVADRIRELRLVPFSRGAVIRVIDESARIAGDSERLSMHMRSLDDLLIQSSYWGRQTKAELIEAEHVEKALQQQVSRLSRVQQNIVDAIHRNSLLIDTAGEQVGQVNGLAVSTLGEFQFGHPVRITATTRIGTGNVVDVEREVELGGAIHSKAMMILSSALMARYAPDVPLSMHGSVVFEQSYSGIEGDSASVAELSALISSLSGTPIRQGLAVTGSINQLGRVQVIGGVNEKIEGFFEVCRTRELDGTQGVIIPRDNVKHLMLRKEVVDAVSDGKFHIYAVDRIDEAIEILTGVDAGERDSDGEFPAGSVNAKVEQQLIDYAHKRQSFGAVKEGKDAEE
ncbi:MAG: ATP-binding protein [Woeseiaceae bacterium]|nr:ATP-binding protein [Woeseiaceae bacterium]